MQHVFRYIFPVLLFLSWVAISCQPARPSDEKRSDIASFEWLVGEWLRQNDPAGKQTFEYWQQSSDSVYIGLGCTLTAGDTTFREDLRIHKAKDGWFYEVTGVHEKPVQFRIIAVQPTGFIAENPENEFPKEISYTRTGVGLRAVIADQQQEIAFEFVEKK